MTKPHEPREHDHLVEPMYGALREEKKPQSADARWKIVWAIIALLAIGYIVWRQAF